MQLLALMVLKLMVRMVLMVIHGVGVLLWMMVSMWRGLVLMVLLIVACGQGGV